MKLLYYEDPLGNVGDDLNPWLWKKLLPGLFDPRYPGVFVGIGTILDSRIPAAAAKKVVFGTGIGSFRDAPKIDDSWEVRFVRGPISAQAIGGAKYISDSAYCLKLLRDPVVKTQEDPHIIGLIPHHRSLALLNWDQVSRATGTVLLPITLNVDDFLQQISRCKAVITEAMHGAIIADCLGIPWCRLSAFAWRTEGMNAHSLKWLDWGMSVGVNPEPRFVIEFPAHSTNVMACMAYAVPDKIVTTRRTRKLIKEIGRLIACEEYECSTDRMRDSIVDQMNDEVEAVRRSYPV